MKRAIWHLGIAGATLCLLGTAAHAQRGVHVASAPGRTAFASHGVMARAVTGNLRTGHMTGTNTVLTNGSTFPISIFPGSGLTVQELLDQVPGQGFDFSHLAAINKNLAIRAFIDPATELQVALAERLLRESQPLIFPFPLFDGGGAVVTEPQPQQPPVIIIQQPGAAQQVAENVPEFPPGPAAEAQPAQVLPDVGQFTLVLKDGSKLQASAFTRAGERVIYITPQGLRRSVALSDIDAQATKNLNEDNGVPLDLS